MELQERRECYNEVKVAFGNRESVYKDFLNYYSKNWPTNLSINLDTIEGQDRFVKTINICEQYNRRLKQIIQLKHPRLAILIINLLEEEALF